MEEPVLVLVLANAHPDGQDIIAEPVSKVQYSC